jgi:hypothetical protein
MAVYELAGRWWLPDHENRKILGPLTFDTARVVAVAFSPDRTTPGHHQHRPHRTTVDRCPVPE